MSRNFMLTPQHRSDVVVVEWKWRMRCDTVKQWVKYVCTAAPSSAPPGDLCVEKIEGWWLASLKSSSLCPRSANLITSLLCEPIYPSRGGNQCDCGWPNVIRNPICCWQIKHQFQFIQSLDDANIISRVNSTWDIELSSEWVGETE